MIYTNAGLFKPLFILISVIFIPLLTLGITSTIFGYKIEFLIGTLMILLFYLVSIFGIYRYAKSKKHYTIINENSITINYPSSCVDLNDLTYDYQEITIHFNDIIRIEYYKILSLKSWFILPFNFLCPQCAFITFHYNDEELYKHIGYLNYNDIKKLCDKLQINLITK